MKIDLKLKTYEELQNEVISLSADSYLRYLKIEQLQSNWNSLREYVEELYNKQGSWASCGARYILDKMNELEWKDKEC